jgi:hypothetical protein
MQAITIMRIAALAALMLLLPVSAQADPPKAAVFDFELLDTSLQGEMDGPRRDEQQRLIRASDQIRKGLAESGKFTILDIAPVNAACRPAAAATWTSRKSSVPIWRSPAWCRKSPTSS